MVEVTSYNFQALATVPYSFLSYAFGTQLPCTEKPGLASVRMKQ
jgi:hypothetical protein